MSRRVGGGSGDTSSARNVSSEDTEDDDDSVTQECDACPMCKEIVEEDQDGLFCDGPCATWFHRKCVNMTPKNYRLLGLTRKKWFCSSCPADQVDDSPTLKWGDYEGTDSIRGKVGSVFKEIVTWRKNLFLVPLGKAGKDFIRELARLLELFTNKTKWEPLALNFIHIFIPLMLQKPSVKSRAKENSQYLAKRLNLWSNGRIDELLSECHVIQSRLKNDLEKSKPESKSKAFCRLMLQGKISKALKFVNNESDVVGIHSITDENKESIFNQLKSLHPDSKSLSKECVITSFPDVNVEPVIYEDITGDLIHNIAKNLSGSGGPTQFDTDGWTHILCNRSFSKASTALCQSIADLTKRFCTEDINPTYTEMLMSSRLVVPLDKNPGIRPIGIGEVLRRIMAKAVGRTLRKETQQATGVLQTCTGIDGGIEATIHAMAKAFSDESSEAILLVDAENAFNNLNRKTALANIKSLCPPYYNFLNNCYKSPSSLHINNLGKSLSSGEGTTQGDPGAMDMYGISTIPLINNLQDSCSNDFVKQCWYADDSCSVGSLTGIRKWWDNLSNIGPGYGYFPKPSKTWLIVKDEEKFYQAKEIFRGTSINITTEGHKHLGAVVGTESFRHEYVSSKIAVWVKDIEELSAIATEEPQLALSAFTKGICRRWMYIQRTIGSIAELFRPLENVIRDTLIPAVVGRQVSDLERRLLALPTRFGGLGIQNPMETADIEYKASQIV